MSYVIILTHFKNNLENVLKYQKKGSIFEELKRAKQ